MISWGGAIAGEGGKLRRWQIENKVSKARIGEVHGREVGKEQKLWMLSGEVRDSPFPFPRFIDLGELRSQELGAPRQLNAGNAVSR
jgi:hypothetical protein